MGTDTRSRITPFFLDAAPGKRFCLLHEPPAAAPRTGAVLYVHPFAEEMNKSRRMASLQSRLLAGAGCTVLQLDLYGCGDSDGDFADARWDIWKRDIEVACAWLKSVHAAPISLWGLRLGATLAAEYAAQSGAAHGPLLLWQPVISGQAFLTQFLRQKVATEMLAGQERSGTGALRARLSRGEPLEVSGYTLAPALALAIDAASLVGSARAGARAHWFELAGESAAEAGVATLRATEELRRQGMQVDLQVIRGDPFWGTVEIVECPPLLDATLSVLMQ
ncbi:MAG: hydrolase 2, exosortase A system-associated [Burkholderiales bacterium]|nr:hydrolase 2, exosortase A system-associated [Burkholderiales bacterium]